ncbi:YjbR protein [Pseudonocardia hierapolitana]|uniref:YjbR protein n=1 Tax=Pseudonocardia hierapolitana TaxID=1128676 RepID=A0A561T2R6_9PSEU|nr:MmcQ/YjbR family DNA-binding protein [Pseudonocardia hierapolitana]TWF81413.1 YjbR protein [Pseudonocardia hierapolitana]
MPEALPPPAAALLSGVRVRCMALPEVTEGLTHGAPTWFVRGRRSFVKFVDPDDHPQLDLPEVAIWAAAPPGARQELTAAAPDRFFEPRFGGRDWVGMRLDAGPGGPDWDEIGEVIADAYRQVAPRKLVARLDHTPGS